MVDNNKILLVITGCLNPVKDQKYLIISNVNVRINQYYQSIDYYIRYTTIKNIVFCENSGYECAITPKLNKTASLFNKNFEYLSFRGDSSLVTRYSNKGIGEDEIMNYICNNSKLYKEIEIITKVTGRLILRNIDQLLKNIDYNNYFYQDLYRGKDREALDTRFYIILKETYESRIRNCYSGISDYTICYEKVFYQLLHPYYCQLPEYMHFEGVSAGNGIDYSEINKYRIKIFDFMPADSQL